MQEIVVQTLSDVETLLSVIDQMIAKKRDLRRAAMQQFLTGKTRLSKYRSELVEKDVEKNWENLWWAIWKIKSGFVLILTSTSLS